LIEKFQNVKEESEIKSLDDLKKIISVCQELKEPIYECLQESKLYQLIYLISSFIKKQN